MASTLPLPPSLPPTTLPLLPSWLTYNAYTTTTFLSPTTLTQIIYYPTGPSPPSQITQIITQEVISTGYSLGYRPLLYQGPLPPPPLGTLFTTSGQRVRPIPTGDSGGSGTSQPTQTVGTGNDNGGNGGGGTGGTAPTSGPIAQPTVGPGGNLPAGDNGDPDNTGNNGGGSNTAGGSTDGNGSEGGSNTNTGGGSGGEATPSSTISISQAPNFPSPTATPTLTPGTTTSGTIIPIPAPSTGMTVLPNGSTVSFVSAGLTTLPDGSTATLATISGGSIITLSAGSSTIGVPTSSSSALPTLTSSGASPTSTGDGGTTASNMPDTRTLSPGAIAGIVIGVLAALLLLLLLCIFCNRRNRRQERDAYTSGGFHNEKGPEAPIEGSGKKFFSFGNIGKGNRGVYTALGLGGAAAAGAGLAGGRRRRGGPGSLNSNEWEADRLSVRSNNSGFHIVGGRRGDEGLALGSHQDASAGEDPFADSAHNIPSASNGDSHRYSGFGQKIATATGVGALAGAFMRNDSSKSSRRKPVPMRDEDLDELDEDAQPLSNEAAERRELMADHSMDQYSRGIHEMASTAPAPASGQLYSNTGFRGPYDPALIAGAAGLAGAAAYGATRDRPASGAEWSATSSHSNRSSSAAMGSVGESPRSARDSRSNSSLPPPPRPPRGDRRMQTAAGSNAQGNTFLADFEGEEFGSGRFTDSELSDSASSSSGGKHAGSGAGMLAAGGIGGFALGDLAAAHRESQSSTYSQGYYGNGSSNSHEKRQDRGVGGSGRHSHFLSADTPLLGPGASHASPGRSRESLPSGHDRLTTIASTDDGEGASAASPSGPRPQPPSLRSAPPTDDAADPFADERSPSLDTFGPSASAETAKVGAIGASFLGGLAAGWRNLTGSTPAPGETIRESAADTQSLQASIHSGHASTPSARRTGSDQSQGSGDRSAPLPEEATAVSTSENLPSGTQSRSGTRALGYLTGSSQASVARSPSTQTGGSTSHSANASSGTSSQAQQRSIRSYLSEGDSSISTGGASYSPSVVGGGLGRGGSTSTRGGAARSFSQRTGGALSGVTDFESEAPSSRATAGDSGEQESSGSGKKRPRSNSLDDPARLSDVYEGQDEDEASPFASRYGHFPSASLGAAVMRQANRNADIASATPGNQTGSANSSPTRSRLVSGPRPAAPALTTSTSSPSLREIGGPRQQRVSEGSSSSSSWRPSPRVASAAERAQQQLESHSRGQSGSRSEFSQGNTQSPRRGSLLRLTNEVPDIENDPAGAGAAAAAALDAEEAENADARDGGFAGWPRFLRF